MHHDLRHSRPRKDRLGHNPVVRPARWPPTMPARTSHPAAIRLRAFEPADHAAAWSLWQRTPGVGLSAADEPQAIQRFLQRNPGLSFVAADGQALVGTLLCGHDGRRGLIHHLVVDGERRRCGIATALLDAARAALATQGIDKAHLLVFRSNEEGLAFWNRVAVARSELALYSVNTRAAGSP
jgi:ribosomal protein S18 acetylase RimI-like enzyme